MYWSVYKAAPLRGTGGCAITCHHALQVIPIIVGQVSLGKAQWDEALQIAEMVNRPYERLWNRNSKSPFLHRHLGSALPGPRSGILWAGHAPQDGGWENPSGAT